MANLLLVGACVGCVETCWNVGLTVALVARVPAEPAREVLDVVPLMMNYQDVFIAGDNWARAKFKFPSVF
jgi:hypothetical protein